LLSVNNPAVQLSSNFPLWTTGAFNTVVGAIALVVLALFAVLCQQKFDSRMRCKQKLALGFLVTV
jgi:hypothetical protein